MADLKTIRINKVLRELNISLDRAVEHLAEKGFQVEARPTTKISQQEYELLLGAFQTDRSKKEASHEVFEEKRKEKEAIREQTQKEAPPEPPAPKPDTVVRAQSKLEGLKTVGKIDLNPKPKPKPAPKVEAKKEEAPAPAPAPKVEAKKEEAPEPAPAPTVDKKTPEQPSGKIETHYKKLSGLKATGQKIDLAQFKNPEPKKPAEGRGISAVESELLKIRGLETASHRKAGADKNNNAQ